MRVTNASLKEIEAWYTLHWRSVSGSIYLQLLADEEIKAARKLESKPKMQGKKHLLREQLKEPCKTPKKTGPEDGPLRSWPLWEFVKAKSTGPEAKND